MCVVQAKVNYCLCKLFVIGTVVKPTKIGTVNGAFENQINIFRSCSSIISLLSSIEVLNFKLVAKYVHVKHSFKIFYRQTFKIFISRLTQYKHIYMW